jgi:Xaa-Pro aminopeptidase
VAETAIEKVLPQLRAGLTEKEVAALVTRELLAVGAEEVAFPTIASAGPNAASPHGAPTNRPLQEGDLLVIDWGAVVDGYVSDITRTFAVGHLDEELRLVYDVVKTANEAGKEAAQPGASGADIDRAARSVIENAGYGDYFIHRTGHGLGLEAHENPSLVAGNDDPLPVGAVFTVEPGIYLPGRGGVRIEDDVVLTSQGPRSLTTFPRMLRTI